jgi:hypothetical protein
MRQRLAQVRQPDFEPIHARLTHVEQIRLFDIEPVSLPTS